MTLRLLVADDNAAMQKMVLLAFAGEDAVIKAVSSGDAAIDILHEFRPDVVLADVSMPGYNGYEVCKLIRQDREFAAIPVILLNGAFDSLDEAEAARVEASGHLTKPLDPSEMIGLVESLLESARRPAPDFSDNAPAQTAAGSEITAETQPPPVEHVAPADITHAELRENAETSSPYMKSAAFDQFFHVTPRALESYLGPDRVLEIFTDETFEIFRKKAAGDWRFPDELADRIAEKVVKKMLPAIETLLYRKPANEQS